MSGRSPKRWPHHGQISRMFGDDVLFQIEVPVESVLVARRRPLRPALAALLR
jgi:hypothetical protein